MSLKCLELPDLPVQPAQLVQQENEVLEDLRDNLVPPVKRVLPAQRVPQVELAQLVQRVRLV
jgi:hypothetical protein